MVEDLLETEMEASFTVLFTTQIMGVGTEWFECSEKKATTTMTAAAAAAAANKTFYK